MRISHAPPIRRFSFKVEARRRELTAYLRTGRYGRARAGEAKPSSPAEIMISERPA
jgi:hypothetical protein